MPVATPDITGLTFGILTAIRMVGRNPRGNALWECSCICGGSKVMTAAALKQPGMRSCGCMVKKRPYTKLFKHGMTNTPEFRVWSAIIYRCHNSSAKAYPDYGGRGITVCDEWRNDFASFLAHIGPRPEGKFSVDRIENARGYEPGNVRWATDIEQQRNRRNVRMLTFNGETLSLPVWAQRLGLPNDALSRRIRAGWPIERALSGFERIHLKPK